MTEVIVGVSLVRARPGVVSANVEFMLVIATPIMVYLVGIEFRRGADGLSDRREMNLHRQTLFSTSTDNVRGESVSSWAPALPARGSPVSLVPVCNASHQCRPASPVRSAWVSSSARTTAASSWAAMTAASTSSSTRCAHAQPPPRAPGRGSRLHSPPLAPGNLLHQAKRDMFGLAPKCRKINHTQSVLQYLVPSALAGIFGALGSPARRTRRFGLIAQADVPPPPRVSSYSGSKPERIQQLCYDHTRKTLYARTHSYVQAYDAKAASLVKEDTIIGYAAATVVTPHAFVDRPMASPHRFLLPCCSRTDAGGAYKPLTHGNIIYIAPITKLESATLILLAVTDKGVLVFILGGPGFVMRSPSHARPSLRN